VSEKGFASTVKKCLICRNRRGRTWLAGKVCILGRVIQTDMPQKSRATLYLRVSTADQKPDLQFDGLRAYAERAEFEIVRDYLDVAVSGQGQGRPQLDALIREARDRAFDCVLVWKFDRFARSTTHLLSALEEFNHLGIRFVSIQDQIDTASPMGKAVFTLIGAMAELESSLISERVSAGMRAAKAHGKHLARIAHKGAAAGRWCDEETAGWAERMASPPTGGRREWKTGQNRTRFDSVVHV